MTDKNAESSAPNAAEPALLGMASMRPTSGARFAFERTKIATDHVDYEGFFHLPERDIPFVARVVLSDGAVTVTASSVEGLSEARAAELEKAASQLLRAATKSEVTAGRPLPRKVVRWRAV